MGRNNDEAAAPAEATASGVEKFTTSASGEEDARKLEVSFDFGGNTARAVELFGEEAVYANFLRGGKVTLQGYVRAQISDIEKTDEEILAKVSEWKPGNRSSRSVSKTSKIEKLMEGMSDEERQALIESLTAASAE